MHFCVINKAIIVFIVVAVVPASITFAFLDNTKTKRCFMGLLGSLTCVGQAMLDTHYMQHTIAEACYYYYIWYPV